MALNCCLFDAGCAMFAVQCWLFMYQYQHHNNNNDKHGKVFSIPDLISLTKAKRSKTKREEKRRRENNNHTVQ